MNGEVHIYMRGQSGTRNVGFTRDGLSVLVSPTHEEQNERAEELARLLAQEIEGLARLADRIAAAEARAEKSERDHLRTLAKVPPARPARLMGPGFVRFDPTHGVPWLLGQREKGWASFGVMLDSWDDLFRRYDVRVTEHGTDEHGAWWRVENIARAA